MKESRSHESDLFLLPQNLYAAYRHRAKRPSKIKRFTARPLVWEESFLTGRVLSESWYW